jgi:hypothetical protein
VTRIYQILDVTIRSLIRIPFIPFRNRWCLALYKLLIWTRVSGLTTHGEYEQPGARKRGDMKFEDYEKGRAALYSEFAEKVRDILELLAVARHFRQQGAGNIEQIKSVLAQAASPC